MDEFITLMLQSIEQNAKQIILKTHAIYGYCDAIKDFINLNKNQVQKLIQTQEVSNEKITR